MILWPVTYFCITCTCIFSLFILPPPSVAQDTWRKNPAITLAAEEQDPRIQSVNEAVHFWNSTLKKLNISLQFGEIFLVPLPKMEETLETMSAEDLAGDAPLPYPDFMDDFETEILIVLTDAEIVSFAEYWQEKEKALVAIKSDRSPPLSLPNVPRNVIAHELGHVLGLDHNDDARMLMCGRPAPCHPERFASFRFHFMKLTEHEKKLLQNAN